jgi:uncharacterized protein YhfF
MIQKSTIVSYWAAFKTDTGTSHDDYDVVEMGDSPKMARELADLIIRGVKRATASLARDYSLEGNLPKQGDYVIVVDASGPRCIWMTTEVNVKPMIDVDEAFAWDEGEGEQTQGWWLAVHRDFFTRQAAREGFAMHDQMSTVFERFKVVWPPEVADRD